MFVHVYENGVYTRTNRYNTKRSMMDELRREGISFKTNKISSLGDRTIFITKGNTDYEIEEVAGSPYPRDPISIDGKTYIPINDYCARKGISKRKAKYICKMNMVEFIHIGLRNFIYMLWEDDNGNIE